MQDLRPFFAEQHFIETKDEGSYEPLQWGANIDFATNAHFNCDDADIVIVGCGEARGENRRSIYSGAPDAIREELYKLYNWHPSIKISDAGNIRQGASVDDTRAALRLVLHELQQEGKIVLVLGGSHDLTLQQYEAFKESGEGINAVVADMLIDLDETEGTTHRSFLMDMLTSHPNFVRHYSHIGFQSYHVHPRMLETLDKLRFDFFRLGKVRSQIEDMEPVLRDSHLFSFDMNAVRYSDAPAGMSNNLRSFGVYGYHPGNDTYGMTAKLAAQMIWYFIDGYQVRKNEAQLTEREEYIEFHITFTSNDTTFLKSKRTGRWWMQLPNKNFVPCSYSDYLLACNDEIPERWLREQERFL